MESISKERPRDALANIVKTTNVVNKAKENFLALKSVTQITGTSRTSTNTANCNLNTNRDRINILAQAVLTQLPSHSNLSSITFNENGTVSANGTTTDLNIQTRKKVSEIYNLIINGQDPTTHSDTTGNGGITPSAAHTPSVTVSLDARLSHAMNKLDQIRSAGSHSSHLIGQLVEKANEFHRSCLALAPVLEEAEISDLYDINLRFWAAFQVICEPQTSVSAEEDQQKISSLNQFLDRLRTLSVDAGQRSDSETLALAAKCTNT